MTVTDGSIYLVIAGTFFGFIGLAFILLFPVYRFMKRQERLADDWTDDAVRRRSQDRQRRTSDDEPSRPD